MKKVRNALSLLMLLLVLLPAAALSPSEQGKTGAQTVTDLLTLVRREFIDDVPAPKLVNGAIDHLKKTLAEKKLDASALSRVPEAATQSEAIESFNKQFEALAVAHPELMNENWLTYQAVEGMLKVLDDPYTVFLEPKEYARLRETMSGGNFGGLGIYIELDEKNEKWLTVVEPIDGTPAARAGIKPRDIIVKIDGHSTRGITIEEAQTRLRGKIGSEVTLTVRRKNVADPFDVKMVRDQIHVASVKGEMVEHNGHKVGYIKLRLFGDQTNQEMESIMRDLEQKGAEAFLLDIRNNGGGYIGTAVDVCSKFLPTGSLVVTVNERASGNTRYDSRPNMRRQTPLVLLVNEYSASASEITAGAMQDFKRAKLVGVKTFGKGSVQKIYPLPDGSAIKVTTAHYLTPNGKDLHKKGVEPDVKVEMAGEKIGSSEDVQFNKAIDLVVQDLGPSTQPQSNTQFPEAIRVSSVTEMVEALAPYEVIERSVKSVDGYLLEEVTVRGNNGQVKTLIFDISSFVGK